MLPMQNHNDITEQYIEKIVIQMFIYTGTPSHQ